MKKEKYLNSLRRFLESKKVNNITNIVKKYENKINEEISNGKTIKEVINSFKSFDEIYKEEKPKKLKINFRSIKERFKEIKIKKPNYLKILLYVLIISFSCFLIFNLVLLFSSLFLILDGVKSYGISILLLSISVLNYLCLLIMNKKINNSNINFKKYLNIVYANFILCALGISLILVQYYRIDMISDVKEKYEIKNIEKEITLPSDKSKKYYIHFNSWYKNKYIVHYDNSMSNIIKIKLEYYECFYNSIITTKVNSIYISLVKDSRDLFSFYIENLKEDKIYNSKELSRNVINIYVSEEDYERLIFID